MVFSYGGKQDGDIVIALDRHSRVFETVEQLQAEGYVNATEDDALAADRTLIKIGLVYHGTKGYSRTDWAKT